VGDVAGMAQAALALLRDPAHWRRWSEAGVGRARGQFAIGDIVSQYEALYRSVM
jgi:glycosyltransferase involved in cell wall biosynthesis